MTWTSWSLLEFFHFLHIMPADLGGELKNPDEYVNKMAGWINRTIELKERLKCDYCGTPFKSNLKYAKFLASYNQTMYECIHKDDNSLHDQDIYINHCWYCKKVIDSREGGKKVEKYYLCLDCGSGNKESKTFTQGDKCPNCGELNMEKSPHHKRGYACRKCHHEIIIPIPEKLTGNPERIEQRIREMQ